MKVSDLLECFLYCDDARFVLKDNDDGREVFCGDYDYLVGKGSPFLGCRVRYWYVPSWNEFLPLTVVVCLRHDPVLLAALKGGAAG